MNKKIGSFISCDPEYISKRRSNGDVLLIKLDESEVYFTLDGISADVWEELSGGASIEETEDRIIKKFPNEEKEIRTLMKKLIKDLTKNKIISVSKNKS